MKLMDEDAGLLAGTVEIDETLLAQAPLPERQQQQKDDLGRTRRGRAPLAIRVRK